MLDIQIESMLYCLSVIIFTFMQEFCQYLPERTYLETVFFVYPAFVSFLLPNRSHHPCKALCLAYDDSHDDN